LEIRCRIDKKDDLTLRCGDYHFWAVDNPLPHLPKMKAFLESRNVVYAGIDDAPPSEAAVTPPLRMRDDLNTAVTSAVQQKRHDLNAALKVAVNQARTETLARLVDLDNPALSEEERLTRANHCAPKESHRGFSKIAAGAARLVA
jgi:hypothetical protein